MKEVSGTNSIAIKSTSLDPNSDTTSVASSFKSRLAIAAPAFKISGDVKEKSAKLGARSSSTPRCDNSDTNTPALQSPSTSVSNKTTVVSAASSGTTTTAVVNVATTSITSTASTTTSKRSGSLAPSKKLISFTISSQPCTASIAGHFSYGFQIRLSPKPEIYVDDRGVGGKLLGRTMKLVLESWKSKLAPAMIRIVLGEFRLFHPFHLDLAADETDLLAYWDERKIG